MYTECVICQSDKGSFWLLLYTCLLLGRLTNSCTIFTHNALHGGDDLLYNRRWHWCCICSTVRVCPEVINQFLAKHIRHQTLPSQHSEKCFCHSFIHNKTGHHKKPLSECPIREQVSQGLILQETAGRDMTIHNNVTGQECVLIRDKCLWQTCLADTISSGLQQGCALCLHYLNCAQGEFQKYLL